MKIPFFGEQRFVFHRGCKDGAHSHGRAGETAVRKPKNKETKEAQKKKKREKVKAAASVARKTVAKRVAVQAQSKRARQSIRPQKVPAKRTQQSIRPQKAPKAVSAYIKNGKVDVASVRAVASTITVKTLIELQKKDHDLIKKIYCPVTGDYGGEKMRTFQSHGNSEVLYKIGLIDVYRYEPGLRSVRVMNNTRNKNMTGHRAGYSGNFYTTGKSYVAILDGDRIVEKSRWNASKVAQKKIEHKQNVTVATQGISDALKTRNRFLPKVVQAPVAQTAPYLKQRAEFVKTITDESIRQGVEPGLLVAYMTLYNVNRGFAINLRRLRWICTDIKTDSLDFERKTGRKAKGKNGFYRVDFLAYYAQLRGVPAGHAFSIFKTTYEVIAGMTLEGTAADIASMKAILKKKYRRGRGKRGASVNEALYRRPKLRMVWEQIVKKLQAEQIPVDTDLQRQDGRALLFLGRHAINLLNPATITLLKEIVKYRKNWKVRLNDLEDIHRYASMSYLAAYRTKTKDKLLHGSLAAMQEVLKEMPSKHVQLSFSPRAGITSPYSYRNAIPRVGVSAGLHRAFDISQGRGAPLRVTFPCRVIRLRRTGRNMGKAAYIVVETRDHNGDMLRFGFVHLQSGSIPAHIGKGSMLQPGAFIGREGNTGRSTAPHLHLWVMRKGRATGGRWMDTDPLPYVDRHTQRRVIRRRLRDPQYHAKFKRYRDSIRRYRNTELPRTYEVLRNYYQMYGRQLVQ